MKGEEYMSLIKCEECGKEMSETARKCPNCGYNNLYQEKLLENKLKLVIVILLIIFVMLVTIVSIQMLGKEADEKNIDTEKVVENAKNEVKSESTKNTVTTSRPVTSSRPITHYCEAGGCYSEGIYAIKGITGRYEYYCYKHYNEMQELLDVIVGN